MPRRIVVTGCARSGTGYMAKLLSKCGVQCGHEAVFMPDGCAGWGKFAAESSWLALPHLRGLENAFVIHLVRHPVRQIRSKVLFFEQGPDASVYHAAIAREIPDVFSTRTDPLERAAYYWVAWNRLVAAACDEGLESGRIGAMRIPIENVGGRRLDAFFFGVVLNVLGFDVSQSAVQSALDSVPKNYNAHARPDPRALQYGWDDLLRTRVGPELRELATQYGYDDERKAIPW